MSGVLVIGNGPAAVRLTHALRHNGYGGPVTVIGRRPGPATQRALLPSVVDGSLSAESLALPDHPDDVAVHPGVAAARVDRRRRLVHTDRGGPHAYDMLVLATGSRPRLPALPGLVEPGGRLSEGATTLHVVEDTTRIAGGHVVVLGAGPLGVETAAALRRRGRDVTVVSSGSHPLPDHLDAVAGRLLADRLEERGITLRLGHPATEYTPGKLTFDDGHVLNVDALVVCAGEIPRTGLAAGAGLPVRRGIVVDVHLRTADPHVSAIGACAEPVPAGAGSVGAGPVAEDQAGALAARIARGAGPPAPPPALRLRDPDLDVAAYGSLAAPEQITLHDAERGRYARLALRGQRIVGAVLIGLPHGVSAVGRLYRQGEPLPTDRLALLLGTDPRTATTGEPSEDTVICRCNHVTRRALVMAWRAGARDLPRIAATTRATTGCRGCVQDVLATVQLGRSG